MGTDVHVVFQKKTEAGWEDIPHNYEENRHYLLFSWLASVRNGRGFAGVATYKPIKPISEPRGYPHDFVVEDDDHPVANKGLLGPSGKWHEEGEPLNVWLGDHSHSWLTADEILAAERQAKLWRTGIVPRAFFDQWDGHTEPESWSGGITGPGVVVADSPTDVRDDSTYVRIFWLSPDGLDYFVDEVRRLKNEHGEVRMVFGFDS